MRPRVLAGEAGQFLIALVALLVAGAIVLSIFFLKFSTAASRHFDTQQQLLALATAIRGDTANGNFGYLGDMGVLPNLLADLIVLPAPSGTCPFTVTSVPTYSTVSQYGVGHGWNGPYVNRSLFFQLGSGDTVFKDQWGTAFTYQVFTPSMDSSLPTGQKYALITSLGPDGVFGTADDLQSEKIYMNGHMQMMLQMGSSVSGTIPASVGADMWYFCDGVQSPTPLTSTTFSFTGAAGQQGVLDFPVTHHGPHAIMVNNGSSLFEPSVLPVYGGIMSQTVSLTTTNEILVTSAFQCLPKGSAQSPNSAC